MSVKVLHGDAVTKYSEANAWYVDSSDMLNITRNDVTVATYRQWQAVQLGDEEFHLNN